MISSIVYMSKILNLPDFEIAPKVISSFNSDEKDLIVSYVTIDEDDDDIVSIVPNALLFVFVIAALLTAVAR